MCRKLILLVSLVSILGLVGSASALELQDTDLANFVDWGQSTSSLDFITDVSGNPGMKYDFTYGSDAGNWHAMGLRLFTNPGFAPGGTWFMTFKNTDPLYSYPVGLDIQLDTTDGLDGWSFVVNAGGWNWIDPGQERRLRLDIPTGWTTLNAIGFEIGDWAPTSGRPLGSSSSIQVVPEPATIALLGLGGLLLRRRNRK